MKNLVRPTYFVKKAILDKPGFENNGIVKNTTELALFNGVERRGTR